MKISNSKKELARIISKNGGWRDGNYAVQDKDDKKVWFMRALAGRPDGASFWPGVKSRGIPYSKVLTNWHQTILSREEYLHLYPVPDANPQFCESVMQSIPGLGINSKNININITQVDDIDAVESKPTLEQLAADYRNAKDYAERKQEEADDAKADADEALRNLELAGEAIGLLVSPITAKQENELATVQVGDEVECVESNIKRDKYNGMVGRLRTIDESDTSTPYLIDFGNKERIWCHEVKFIHRPS